jgi:hypothetical protein
MRLSLPVLPTSPTVSWLIIVLFLMSPLWIQIGLRFIKVVPQKFTQVLHWAGLSTVS